MKPIVLAVGVEGVQRCMSVFGEVYWHALVHEKGYLGWHFWNSILLGVRDHRMCHSRRFSDEQAKRLKGGGLIHKEMRAVPRW